MKVNMKMDVNRRKDYRRKTKTNIHHKKPISLGGTNHPDNLVRVKRSLHSHWHSLFHTMSPEEIAKEINRTWLDPEFKLVVERRSK